MDISAENADKTDENMHKTSGYVRTVVAIHNLRDSAKEAVESLQEKSLSEHVNDKWNQTREAVSSRTRHFFAHPDDVQCEHIPGQYSYMFRPKSTWELVLLSGTVCGIEFCYSAETAFVTPILLSLGLNIKFVTMIWCLSPLIGFFLTPVLGSLSDSCESKFGRRRPFILLLSTGILLGLILVPNGHKIGISLGDTRNLGVARRLSNDTDIGGVTFEGNFNDSLKGTGDLLFDGEATRNVTTVQLMRSVIAGNMPSPNLDSKVPPVPEKISEKFNSPEKTGKFLVDGDASRNVTVMHDGRMHIQSTPSSGPVNETESAQTSEKTKRLANTQSSVRIPAKNVTGIHVQPWSIAFTVIGTVLLDFCSDACQSPSRTYLLDVSLHEDHNAGLSTFTLMAGLGGSLGYLMGAVHWEATFFGHLLGGQINAVFTMVTIVFVFCLIATLCSFPEIPLPVLNDPKVHREYQQKLKLGEFQEKGSEMEIVDRRLSNYGTSSPNGEMGGSRGSPADETLNGIAETSERKVAKMDGINNLRVTPAESSVPASKTEQTDLKEYLRSIIHMPRSLQILCVTNLFSWMSLVCYSLYFTDFVGEVVYGGDPQAPEESHLHQLYNDGISFGCWGMALYSISCSVYSYFIEVLVKRFGAKAVYVGGQLMYSLGMIIMAAARHPVAVILLSPTAGVMYSTLFTMPYLLIAHYHCMQKFRDDKSGGECGIRGIGTDVASVSSMVFLSQFILSLTMGSIVEAVGSNVATVCAAAFLSACGAISATQVMYLDM